MSEIQRTNTLQGTRVLEFTHAVLGPTCGMMLAEMGAEVIRVEPPNGEPTRRLKGFGMGYFPFFNRGKKSLAVNLKSPEGLEIIHRLLESTDVLVENFGPGTMDRLGLGYEALHPKYPKLVYCELKGFLPGPYAHRTALDEVVQMMSGLAYMTGPQGQPLRAGASVIDVMTGMMGALGVMGALQQRAQTGKGQRVRSALFETAAFLMGHHMTYAAVTQTPVPPMPERVSAWAIYHQFETADHRRVFIGVTSDKQWLRFCQVFEKPGWAEDERLLTNNDRIREREWFLPAVRELVNRFSLDEILDRCEQAGIPFSPIARPEDLFSDPQLLGGGSLVETQLPGGAAALLPRLPILFENFGDLEGADSPTPAAAPEIGQHTRALMAECGFQVDAVQALAEKNIITISD